ncbi:MAG: enoyl-CoA hydratase/isomerase family protein [Trebonia sp.]
MTSFQILRTDVSDRVATIWLNRPERRNAFSSVMTRELYEAFALFESAEDVRAIVVTGTGRYFSAGADLERGAAREREHEVFRWMGRQADAAEGVTAFLEKRAAVAAVQGQGLSADAVRIARGPA